MYVKTKDYARVSIENDIRKINLEILTLCPLQISTGMITCSIMRACISKTTERRDRDIDRRAMIILTLIRISAGLGVIILSTNTDLQKV